MQVGAISRVLSTSSFAAALFAGAALSSGAVATFQNGQNNPFGAGTYAGADDTRIRGGTDFQHNNWGQGYYAYTIMGIQAYSLIRFDVSSMAGEYNSIESVTLTFKTDNDVNNVPFALHAISAANADWVEGTGDENGITAGGIANAATFAKKFDTSGTGVDVDWVGGPGLGVGTATPGYNPTPAVTGIWNVSGGDGMMTITLPASLIQSWIDNPAANGGLILLETGTPSGQYIVFKGSESAPQNYPKLEINYTPVPEPTAISLLGLGALAMLRRRK